MINPEVKYPIGSWWHIPDSELYVPFYSPWFEGSLNTITISPRRAHLSQWIAIWECGVYKGGTAAMMAAVLEVKCLPGNGSSAEASCATYASRSETLARVKISPRWNARPSI